MDVNTYGRQWQKKKKKSKNFIKTRAELKKNPFQKVGALSEHEGTGTGIQAQSSMFQWWNLIC